MENFLTGSDTRRCRDWGRDVPVIDRNTDVFTFVVAGAVTIGATVSIFHGVWRRGSAPALGAGGRGFDTRRSDHTGP